MENRPVSLGMDRLGGLRFSRGEFPLTSVVYQAHSEDPLGLNSFHLGYPQLVVTQESSHAWIGGWWENRMCRDI